MADETKTEHLTFKCPSSGCNGTTLTEVLYGVTVESRISDIAVTDGAVDLTYDKTENCDGELDRYQCSSCGFIICNADDDPITTEEELIEWLRDLAEESAESKD